MLVHIRTVQVRDLKNSPAMIYEIVKAMKTASKGSTLVLKPREDFIKNAKQWHLQLNNKKT